jgi:hypothetical protein
LTGHEKLEPRRRAIASSNPLPSSGESGELLGYEAITAGDFESDGKSLLS